VGIITIVVMLTIDYWFYGKWIVTPYNFVLFNVIHDAGTIYGSHPWHWYFTSGFTAMLATFLPFFIVGIVMSKNYYLAFLILWTNVIYSFLTHKEFRFVLPVLPLAMIYSGYCLHYIWIRCKQFGNTFYQGLIFIE